MWRGKIQKSSNMYWINKIILCEISYKRWSWSSLVHAIQAYAGVQHSFSHPDCQHQKYFHLNCSNIFKVIYVWLLFSSRKNTSTAQVCLPTLSAQYSNLRKHISCLPDTDTNFSPGTLMKLLSFLLSGTHLTRHSVSHTVLKYMSKQKLNKMYLMFSQINTVNIIAEKELWSEPIKWKNVLTWPLQDAAWHLGKIQGPFQLPGPFHWTVKETFPASPPIHSSLELAHTLWAVPCLHLLLLLLLAQVHLCILAKTSGVNH